MHKYIFKWYKGYEEEVEIENQWDYTCKSLSEALIFASTKPQYDNRLFIELQVQYMKMPSSEHGVFDIQNNFCTQHVVPMFWRRASDKDLPVTIPKSRHGQWNSSKICQY